MQSFTFVLLIAALAVANAGYLASPAISYAAAPAYRTYAPLTTYGNHYGYGYTGYGYGGYAAPAYRTAYAHAAPLATYGAYTTGYAARYPAYGYRSAYGSYLY